MLIERIKNLNQVKIDLFNVVVKNSMFDTIPIAHSGFKVEHPLAKIVIFGAGGTGGWFMPKLVKILNDAKAKFLIPDIEVVVVDGDTVELKNLARQNFVQQDVGKNKAEVMVKRYSPHLVQGINMFYVDKYVTNNTILVKYPKEDRDKFVDISTVMPAAGAGTVLVMNFIDNAVSRKVIHHFACSSTSNTYLLFDVANNSYNGQSNFSYYGNLRFCDAFAPSSFFIDYPDHLDDQEGISLTNCADADVAPQNASQLFNANDFAASIAGNAVNAMIQDKKVSFGKVSFITGNNVVVTPSIPLSNNSTVMTAIESILREDAVRGQVAQSVLRLIKPNDDITAFRARYAEHYNTLANRQHITAYLNNRFAESFDNFKVK